MLLLIDNYDSFTYNLYQYLSELGEEVAVVRNDKTSIAEIEAMSPQQIVISPGPSTPENAGISNDVIRRFGAFLPVLGVCLGHQCIAHAFGGAVTAARRLMHGKTSAVSHDGKGVFRGLPNPLTAMRYHSLAVDEASLPPEFSVTARAEDGEVMGLRHRACALEGVQFHPESYRTEAGIELLRNFLKS